MSWNYEYKKEESIYNVFPEGDYEVTVRNAYQESVKTGERVVYVLRAEHGGQIGQFDYRINLDNSTQEKIDRANRRLSRVEDAFGVSPFAFRDIVGRKAWAHLTVSHGDTKDFQNVHYFLGRDEAAAAARKAQAAAAKGGDDDSIPF